MKPVAFLFGAGISKHARLPLAEEITETLLKGKHIFRQAGRKRSRYVYDAELNPPNNHRDGVLARILLLLQILYTEARIYYFNDRLPNYEDLYFMAHQVLGSITFAEENPVAFQFTKKLTNIFKGLLKDTFSDALNERDYAPLLKLREEHDTSTMPKLIRECCNYVRDIVCALIGGKTADFAYLNWVADAVQDSSSGQKIIFTLNYDLLLETLFHNRGIDFTDGFDSATILDGISYFDPAMYDNDALAHLIKLHGSLNWFTNKPNGTVREPQRFRLIKPVDTEVAKKHFELDIPIVLIGTHNKTTNYSGPIFEDLQARMLSVMNMTSTIVICGYSFGDNAVNTRIRHWLDKCGKNRMVLIHHNSVQCMASARAGLNHVLKYLEDKGQLRVIEKRAEDVKWNEIVSHVG
jgi:hypothetical protein